MLYLNAESLQVNTAIKCEIAYMRSFYLEISRPVDLLIMVKHIL